MAAMHDHTPVTTVPTDDETVVEFRTPEGESVVFEGVSEAEAKAKAHDFLAWAS